MVTESILSEIVDAYSKIPDGSQSDASFEDRARSVADDMSNLLGNVFSSNPTFRVASVAGVAEHRPQSETVPVSVRAHFLVFLSPCCHSLSFLLCCHLFLYTSRHSPPIFRRQ